MVPAPISENIYDPIEVFGKTLADTWHLLCDTYDVTGSLPEMDAILDGIDMSDPDRAAQDVLVNLLTEIIEQVCRFSPWYTKPARAFGLVSIVDKINFKPKQILAPEAAVKWRASLNDLARVVRMNSGLIEAALLVDHLMRDISNETDPCIVVSCGCLPRIKIRLRKSVLKNAEMTCDNCKEKFHII
jgi:hypothetical protein